MSKKIILSTEQYNRLCESKCKTIIINESQLDIIREYENKKVLHYEFEAKVRKYMDELKNNPCKPLYDEFFSSHGIPEDVLQNKMLDLGLIKRTDRISEPIDADGKKRGVHTRKYIFSGKDFDNKIDKLYNSFFDKGESILKETDCGGAMGGGAVSMSGPSDGGSTNAEGVGGKYDVPFGGVMRRKIGVSGSTDSNIDKEPTLDRTKGKIAVNTVNEGI